MQIKAGIDPPENMLILWEKNQGIIKNIVGRYWGEDEDDLMQEAYIGLHKAAQAYNPETESKFMSYATYWIKQQIRRYIISNKPFNTPEYMQALIQKDKRLTAIFLRDMGRKPTDQERMHHLDITSRQLEALKKVSTMALGSLDAPLKECEDNLHEIVGGDDFTNETLEKMNREELKTILWGMVDSLPKEEGAVIRGRFENGWTQQQCAERLGVEKSKIRTAERRGLNALRHPKNNRQLAPFLKDYERIRREAMKGTGVGRFANTWTSATERVALGINSSFD